MIILMVNGEFRTLRGDREGFAHQARNLLDVLTSLDEQWMQGAITVEERDEAAASALTMAPSRPLDYRELLAAMRDGIREHEKLSERLPVSESSGARSDQTTEVGSDAGSAWRPPWEDAI